MTHQSYSRQNDYSKPFNWWGYRSAPEQPLSITQLIDQQMLDSRIGAFLWMAMEQRASLVVAATPHEAGKTTMLTALLDFLPPGIEQIYLRGWYERFDFLESERDPDTVYLLNNEISSHLPIYMWGRGVRKLFEAAQAGYAFGATVHANDANGVLQLLHNYPLEVPMALLTEIDLVLSLSYRRNSNKEIRRVMQLEVIENEHDRPVPKTIANRDVISTELQSSPGTLINTLVRHFGLDRDTTTDEFARRVAFLDRLVLNRTLSLEDVRRSIDRYRGRARRTDRVNGSA